MLQLLIFVNGNVTQIIPAVQAVYGKAGLLIKFETSQSHTVFSSRQEKERSLLLWGEFYVLQKEEVRRRGIRGGDYLIPELQTLLLL